MDSSRKKAFKSRFKVFGIFEIGIVFVFISIICFTAAAVDLDSKMLSKSILRLHILANSDSQEDQDLKLKVRDAVIKKMEVYLKDAKSETESELIVSEKTQQIVAEAKNIIKEYGYDYDVTAKIDDTYFPTKEYPGLILPAGKYRALVINIGKAEGKNWWCVMYPSVCLSGSVDIDLNKNIVMSTLEKNTAELVTETQEPQIEVRFKVVELFGKLKKMFDYKF